MKIYIEAMYDETTHVSDALCIETKKNDWLLFEAKPGKLFSIMQKLNRLLKKGA